MKKTIFALLLAGVAFSACDDDTSTLGIDIMPEGDNIDASSEIYYINTTTVQVDSVLANTSECLLGSIVDPELRVQTTCNFLAQFHVPDNFLLPDQDILVLNDNDEVEADSCTLRVYFEEFYGDSLVTMKLHVRELDKAKVMEEGVNYYTNINPDDYIDEDGIEKSVSYTIKDLTLPEDENNGTEYYRSVLVKLPAEYGTYLMNTYYEHPEYFANSYKFIHNVCAGFYFEHSGGTGAMITTALMGLNVYFRYHSTTEEGNDTIIDGMQRFGATEEVIQNTQINNEYPGSLDVESLADSSFTYIKTPTGFFTEATLPVSDIVAGEHYIDSINQANVVFRRYNVDNSSDYNLPCPEYLLMVRKGAMKEFFEESKLSDNIDTYLIEYSSTYNVYQYSNIAQLLTVLKLERDEGSGVTQDDDEDARNVKYAAWEAENPDWNKVILIPVSVEYRTTTNYYGTSTKTLIRVQNDLGLSSARLEGGKDTPIEVNVIYSRYSR